MKQKLGRGFTRKELVLGGVLGNNYARSLGIAVDIRYNIYNNILNFTLYILIQ